MLIERSPVVAADLDEVVGLGVRIGIDDFGTGYSSLTYLQHLPISFLKIDTSFVADLHPGIHRAGYRDRPALTKAIVQLSRTLDIEAVAEGIETPSPGRGPRRVRLHLRSGLPLQRPAARRGDDQPDRPSVTTPSARPGGLSQPAGR